jgi:hypothetical protein
MQRASNMLKYGTGTGIGSPQLLRSLPLQSHNADFSGEGPAVSEQAQRHSQHLCHGCSGTRTASFHLKTYQNFQYCRSETICIGSLFAFRTGMRFGYGSCLTFQKFRIPLKLFIYPVPVSSMPMIFKASQGY